MTYETNELGGWIVPDGTTLPPGAVVPSYSYIGDYCTIGNGCTIGNSCRIGNYCTIGYSCTIGNGCRIGYGCSIGNDGTIGNRCIIGYGCTWLGVQVSKWLTLANVDGSGRQLKVVVAVDGSVKVEAGCFVGTADEFCDRAKDEGKGTYVAVVRAVVQALTTSEE